MRRLAGGEGIAVDADTGASGHFRADARIGQGDGIIAGRGDLIGLV